MIITQKKPVEELLAMLEGVTKVAIVGCAQCAAACQTGGEKEVQEMKALLEEHGMEVVGAVLPDECCHKLLVKRDLKALRDAGAQAVTIEIQRGGMALIRVTDNGCGIPQDQCVRAFQRHATSKLRSPQDLAAIGTLGLDRKSVV